MDSFWANIFSTKIYKTKLYVEKKLLNIYTVAKLKIAWLSKPKCHLLKYPEVPNLYHLEMTMH